MSQPWQPPIPDRTSSKRAFEQSIESDSHQKQSIEKEINRQRKKIKAKGSFDAQYWAGYKQVAELELRRFELVRKFSVNNPHAKTARPATSRQNGIVATMSLRSSSQGTTCS